MKSTAPKVYALVDGVKVLSNVPVRKNGFQAVERKIKKQYPSAIIQFEKIDSENRSTK